jgi:hypothetical protein
MRPMILIGASLALVATAPVFADDITGADQLLCASVRATECFADGNCYPGSPRSWDAPRFVRVDFEEKMLRTTKASGEDRSTPMKHIEREGGRIFIQGVEDGRAFSIILDQDTGTTSTAIALEGHVLAIFGNCTPIEPND